MIKAILVDDERRSSETLEIELRRHCPDIEVVAIYDDPRIALQELPSKKFDILFLDIEMPWLNGFELLKQLEYIDFEVVFVTAYDQFAIQAFKVSALDYLLKPVQEEELKSLCKKLKEKHQLQSSERVDFLMERIKSMDSESSVIILPTSEGLEFIKKSNIIRCESSSNYCYIYLTEGKKLFLAKTLKDIEEIISDKSFVRVHLSHLINIRHLTKYANEDGGMLVMEDGSRVPMSRMKKNDIIKLIEKAL
jgi:two-component system, LytTR family, response regulator